MVHFHLAKLMFRLSGSTALGFCSPIELLNTCHSTGSWKYASLPFSASILPQLMFSCRDTH